MKPITREQAQDMAEAHAEGSHTPPEGMPREGCPECEDRPLRDYPSSRRPIDAAISGVEESINHALILNGDADPALRRALLDARGGIREAIGEPRT